MTQAYLAASSAGTPQTAAPADRKWPLWFLIGIFLILSLIMSFSGARSVWQHGTFFDSDDAMQLVQVRNLIHGQNWFDLRVMRLDPPFGVFMHWSRVTDAPLVLLIKFFSLFLPVEYAERATRLVFPLILQGLLYAGLARLARGLMGLEAVIPVLVLTLLSGMMYGQFQPGRINHSASQIVLLVFILGFLVEALAPQRAWRAGLAGALAALSLAISLENLPFVVALSGLAVLLWAVRGAPMAKVLRAFGLGLGVALPLVYVATIGAARWSIKACDAYSLAYLTPGLAGAAMMVLLGGATPRLQNWPARAGAALVAGLVVLAAVLCDRPICFIDPYVGVDPLLRDIWLKNVAEALPLARFFATRPAAACFLMMPIFLGFAAALAAVWSEKGLVRLSWGVVAVLGGFGILMCFWQVRIIGFVSPIALLGGVWAICRLRDHLARARWPALAGLAFLLVLPFSSVGWGLTVAPLMKATRTKSHDACLATSAFAGLAQLPTGRVAGPIDAGSHILALTHHSVLAAPYHRDNHGNRVVLDALLAAPPKARDILRGDGVTYVVNCSGFDEMAGLAKRAPEGLAAHLLAGKPPAWLKPAAVKGPYQVFVMQP